MKSHPDAKYFVRISDEYCNRYVIYEQSKATERGWIYNGISLNHEEIMLFSILDIGSAVEELASENKTIINDEKDFIQAVTKTNEKKQKENMSHGTHVLCVEELKNFLMKNKTKYYRESDK
jgi:hypothetical protein